LNLFPNRQQREEQDLLAKAVSGDRFASQEIIRSLSPSAYSLAWKMVGRKEDAEDVVQEAFIRLWKSSGSFSGKASLRTYFYAIVSNLCLDRLRANSKGAFEEFNEFEHASGVSVDLGVECQWDVAEIQLAIETLSAKQRMAILMWVYQDLTAAEIAKAMGMNKNSVDQLLFRAKMKLKVELEKKGGIRELK